MRSRPRSFRIACLTLNLLTWTVLGSSGCQLNRSFFQMDSNTKVPFFGVDLAPKWPKRSSPVSDVSRLQSHPVNTEDGSPHAQTEPPKELSLPVTDSVAAAPTDDAPVELFR